MRLIRLMFLWSGLTTRGHAEWLGGSDVDFCLLLVVSLCLETGALVFFLFLVGFDGTARIRVSPSCWVNSWSHAKHVDTCAKHKKVRACQEHH